jgi:hypothetical protein
MGDRDFLHGLKSDKPEGDRKGDSDVIMCIETDDAERIPLLWGALFQKDDCSMVKRVWEDLFEGQHGEKKEYTLPVWHVSVAKALENFRSRKDWILQHVHPALHPFVDAFEEGIANSRNPYIQLDLDALYFWMDRDSEAVKTRVEICLSAFESDVAWKVYYSQPSVTDTVDLYGMNFLFPNWCKESIALGWYRVGEDNRIQPAGYPGGMFVVGEPEPEEQPELPLFFVCAANGDLAAVQSLLRSGVDVNGRTDLPRTHGVTSLLLAIADRLRLAGVARMARTGFMSTRPRPRTNL